MNKELNALRIIKQFQVCVDFEKDEYKEISEVLPNSFNIVENALKKLEQIWDILEKYGIDDLEVLDKILEIQMFLNNHTYSTLPSEEYFDLMFNQLKALKIVKEKVMPLVILEDETEISKGYRVYDNELCQNLELTKEEYDLLKEVLL